MRRPTIYAIGGRSSSFDFGDVDVYDPAADRRGPWRVTASSHGAAGTTIVERLTIPPRSR